MYPSVSNKHVTAVTTDKTITPLYQVKEGICDNSYGVHCARMVNFTEDVINSAIGHQNELEHSAGTQFIKNFEPSLKRQVIKEGLQIITDALANLKAKAASLSDEELKKELERIKQECMNGDNLFVKGLLSE